MAQSLQVEKEEWESASIADKLPNVLDMCLSQQAKGLRRLRRNLPIVWNALWLFREKNENRDECSRGVPSQPILNTREQLIIIINKSHVYSVVAAAGGRGRAETRRASPGVAVHR